MIVFPNCKINLGLHILRKRNDGFHDLETVFYPLALTDVLEVIQSTSVGNPLPELAFNISGLHINGEPEENLCLKAYQLLKQQFPQLPVVQMHIHKVIPMGAGLGGGSSDAAFTLKLLNEKFQLGLSTEALLDMALQLGSDCPFFIVNKPCFATGRGEIMQAVPVDLSAYSFVIVHPGIHVSTATAFKNITPSLPAKSIQQIIQQPIHTWKTALMNDFEKSVFEEYPALQQIKEELYSKGAVYASMSGSGSCMYGIFEKGKIPAAVAASYKSFILN